MIKNFIYIIILVFISSCSTDIDSIKKYNWKYSGGECYFGDMIHFESGIFKIMNENQIYYNEYLIGKIVSVDSEYITIECTDGKMAEFIKFGEAKNIEGQSPNTPEEKNK
jgi:hypothetical protein